MRDNRREEEGEWVEEERGKKGGKVGEMEEEEAENDNNDKMKTATTTTGRQMLIHLYFHIIFVVGR